MNIRIYLYSLILIFNSDLFPQTTVEKHGILQVKANHIVNKNNIIVSFSGISLFWSNWAGDYYNDSLIHWLKTDWNCKIVRAAMGIEGNDSGPGYPVKCMVADSVTVQYRIASQSSVGTIELQLIGENPTETLHEISFSSSGGWQNWKTVTGNTFIPEGDYSRRLVAK